MKNIKQIYNNILQWCYKNDVQAHFYILLILSLISYPLNYIYKTIFHLGIWNFILAISTSFIISITTIILREKFNESGWSWEDIINGIIGYVAGTFISFVLVLITIFITWLV